MISGNDYAEVYEILSYMDKATVMKVPIDILNNINEKRTRNYNSNIDRNDLFNFENVSINTKRILAWLDVNYWMDENKKQEIIKEKKEQELLLEEKKKEKYDNNIFKQEEKIENKEIVVKEETLFEKIKNNIRKFIFMLKNK